MNQDNEEASITHEMEEESFKPKVVCIPPDDEMGFLLNLPPPCNVISQPSTIGLSGKVPDSPFMQAYQKFLRGETTIQPPKPVDEPPPDQLPGKKKYIPPYTPTNPNRTKSFGTTPAQPRPQQSSASSNFKPRTSGSFTKPSSGNMGARPQSSTGMSSSNNMNRHNFQRKRQQDSDDEEDLVPIKRESSRRKAKEGNLAKKHMQERLLEDDDEDGGLPGLDLSDSDDDATWDPSKESESRSRHKRLASDDEDEMESYRSVVSTPKKAKKASTFHTTSIVPTDQDFRPGDFVVLRDESNQDQAPVWRFDSKTLLQRFNVSGKDENGETLYTSANLFSGNPVHI